ncbi:hypothetical protein D3C83_131690 [compost metagenome]
MRAASLRAFLSQLSKNFPCSQDILALVTGYGVAGSFEHTQGFFAARLAAPKPRQIIACPQPPGKAANFLGCSDRIGEKGFGRFSLTL